MSRGKPGVTGSALLSGQGSTLYVQSQVPRRPRPQQVACQPQGVPGLFRAWHEIACQQVACQPQPQQAPCQNRSPARAMPNERRARITPKQPGTKLAFSLFFREFPRLLRSNKGSFRGGERAESGTHPPAQIGPQIPRSEKLPPAQSSPASFVPGSFGMILAPLGVRSAWLLLGCGFGTALAGAAAGTRLAGTRFHAKSEINRGHPPAGTQFAGAACAAWPTWSLTLYVQRARLEGDQRRACDARRTTDPAYQAWPSARFLILVSSAARRPLKWRAARWRE